MSDREIALLEENVRLKRIQSRLQEENTQLKEQNDEFERLHASQQRTIKALQERVRYYIRRIYGRKSEKIDVNQMVFDDIILAAEKCLRPEEPAPHPDIVEEKVRAHIRRKHPGRKPLPPELPRIEHYLDIPEKDKYTADGKERPIIGLDITEKLDYRPPRWLSTATFVRSTERMMISKEMASSSTLRWKGQSTNAWPRQGCWRISLAKNMNTTPLFIVRN